MTILSGQTIRRIRLVSPMCERTIHNGMSFGLSSCGYDIRTDQFFRLRPGVFILMSSIERFDMPNNVMGRVTDKSSWARRGLAVQNTVIEPGWRGHLTLELTNHGTETISIEQGDPIAQIIFEFLDEPTEQPYHGKYQDQPSWPVEAIYEDGV